MTFKLQTLSPLMCIVVAVLLSACGNKGDLYLVPDEITQQDLLRLEQALEAETTLSNEALTDEEDEDKDDKDKTKNP